MVRRSTIEAPFLRADHDHGRCIDQALDQAASICRHHGVRLTEIRRRVLELIWTGHKPIGAYDILDTLRKERGSAAPPTVYRALDFLLQHGLIHRIERLNAFVGCTHPSFSHGGQFLICRACGSAAELNDHRIESAIRRSAVEAGFTVWGRTVELEGICPHCQRAAGAGHHE